MPPGFYEWKRRREGRWKRGGGDGEGGGKFAGWAPASTSIPPRPCARRPPPVISIGLPGFTCQAARCSVRVQQPAALAAAPSQLLPSEERAGRRGGGPQAPALRCPRGDAGTAGQARGFPPRPRHMGSPMAPRAEPGSG